MRKNLYTPCWKSCGLRRSGGGVIAPFEHAAPLSGTCAAKKLAVPAGSAPNLLDPAVMASSVLGMGQLIGVHGSAQSGFISPSRSLQACGPSSPSQPRNRQPMSVEGGRSCPLRAPAG